ncbi:hypothetical protein GF336_06160 [Candidatus Woesearchaeota archaeon]|nr:hypothetical protein [Candidatus Woesearchaeota archaeon]
MTDNTKVGIELEMLVTDQEGKLSNRADEILESSLNPGNIVKEGTYSLVEFVSDPCNSLEDLEKDMRTGLKNIKTIADSLGLNTVPLSDIGPDGRNMRREGDGRYNVNSRIWGKERIKIHNTICGTHIHIDKQDENIKQYNLVESLDPVFVMLSSSPFLQGQNTLNSCRVNAYRNKIFGEFPLHGQLTDYLEDASQRDRRDMIRYDQWIRVSGIGEEAKEYFSIDDTCWGPLRERQNTMEARANDTNLPSNILAAAAFYKGINDHVFRKCLDIRVSRDDCDYYADEEKIMLPSYKTLKKLESQGIRYGLKSDIVHDYLSYLTDMAYDGLGNEEKRYLSPFQAMIKYRRNMADMMKSHALSKGYTPGTRLDSQTACEINNMIYNLYSDDIEGKLDYESVLMN